MISFDDFKKVEITVGKILSAEKVPETDKLLKLSVDFGVSPFSKGETTLPSEDGGTPFSKGETTPALADSGTPFVKGDENATAPAHDIRQIVSGIATHFPDAQILVGRKCMFVTNLEQRVIRGLESNGMLLAVSTEDGKFSMLEPNAEIPEGTVAK